MEFCHDDDHKILMISIIMIIILGFGVFFTLNVCQNTDSSDLGPFGFTQFLQLCAGIVP